MKKYYWTTKTGQKIDIDLMDENHLRNALKMILRNIENAEAKEREIRKTRFKLNGDIAQDHYDQMSLAEYEDIMRYGF
jgi:hypothetical protein